jgi:Ca-activated chloride channel family protein
MHRLRGLLVLAAVVACSKSQAWQIGGAHPDPGGGPPVEVVEELPPFTFTPAVHEVHAAPRPQPASLTALPRMVLSNRCIEAGAVVEGKTRVARNKPRSTARVDKKAKPRKLPATPAATTGAEQKSEDSATAPVEAEASPPAPEPAFEPGGSAGAVDEAPADNADASMAQPRADSPVTIGGDDNRKALARSSRKADRRAERERKKFDRASKRAGDQPLSRTAAMPPQEQVVRIPAEMPPAHEGWGQPIYVSNDDSMSLSSAQRVAFAVENFEPLMPGDVRPHELLNWAFGNLNASTDSNRDFAVQGDVLSRSEDGLHTMAIAVHGRRVGRSGRRNAALTLVVDQSGSMKRDNRMDFVRRGMLRMVRELKQGDIINLVTFDNKVCPRVTNFVVGRDDAEILAREVLRIRPRGATNIHAALEKGYALADASYQPAYSNRVLLVTDALANRGITDARTMAMVTDFYDARRIRLSGVGVGKEFNDNLLDTLTEKGRGAYVFLGSEQVVDQVFGDRFVSLVETIANDVHFRLHLPATLRVQRFHGEEASTEKSEVQAVHFFADTSQVLMVDVEAWQGQLRPVDDVMLEIEYQEPETGEVRVEEHVVHLSEAIDSGLGYASNGKVVLAFADGLTTLSHRPPPRGFQARPGGWPDATAIQICADVRDDMLAIEGASWQGSAVDVWNRFCSRYDQALAGRPTRKH